ncbi:DUF2239 family protein [Mesorhizobium sp. NBSH29]|uniref:DUF2239 family protein n=1 Tax=Mesorhizobium sp. NBSH29 TaxID=2654249 RepID=UPI0018967C79|nr:DUF2239 family protein [Mesorhizobium sp. NBSH29]QPC86674.1 DUF2239 family protein [Mesorhizobium sp. NBSH29]
MHSPNYTAFEGERIIASGTLGRVAGRVTAAAAGKTLPLLVFDDGTGKVFDLDLSGTAEALELRYGDADPVPEAEAPRGRGRPKLGVVAREVTLLPRHWDWLNTQPGGASVALRKLVENARRAGANRDGQRAAQDRAYAFMSAMAGNYPDFEDAIRALFKGDHSELERLSQNWPTDVRDYALRLAVPPFD